MSAKTDQLEEQATLARERLRARLDGFGERYSLVALREVGRQVSQGRGRGALRSSVGTVRSNPIVSALLVAATARLLTVDRNDDATDSISESSARQLAGQNPLLGVAAAVILGLGAGYAVFRRKTPRGQEAKEGPHPKAS